jgi:transposase
MAPTTDNPVLFPDHTQLPDGVVVINNRCRLQQRGRYRVVIVRGMPLAHFAAGDRAGEAHAMVILVDLGWAQQREVALAFACDVRTVRRNQRRFEEGGLAALGRPTGFPTGRSRVPQGRIDTVNAWKAEGVSNREIGRRLGIDEKAVRKLAKRLGWKKWPVVQMTIPFESADPKLSASDQLHVDSIPKTVHFTLNHEDISDQTAADPKLSASSFDQDQAPLSLDLDPADRAGDRLLARLGILNDAVPIFGAATQLPGAGVLLAIPALVESGVLSIAAKMYGGIGPAFYGLRTTLVTLLLMALLRIKRPEGLKEHSPRHLGQVLGLDRAPEVKTLRNKLARLAPKMGSR